MSGSPNRRPILVAARARSDLGKTRDHNEDFFLIADLDAGRDLTKGGPYPLERQGSVFLVADGMGGAAAGELASSMAGSSILRHFKERWSRETLRTHERFVELLKASVEQANTELHNYAKEHPEVRGMGTTATVAGVMDSTLYIAQVGDSRAYLIRSGVATQLTKDQSLMQRLVDAGELTEEEAAQSERRNIILQALGPDARIRVDLTWQELQRGDVLVICSDGLSGQVKREEIAEISNNSTGLDALCDGLVALANERGGPDNITVVAAQFEGEGLPPARPSGDVGYHALDEGEEDESSTNPGDQATEAAGSPGNDAVGNSAQPANHPAAEAPKRRGSPRTTAIVTVSVLVVLVILYFVLRDR
jgi:protein phosphatase